MPLSKVWTQKKILDQGRVLVNQIAPDKLQSLDLENYLHLSVHETAEMLNGAALPDYADSAVVNDAASSLVISSVSAVSFTHSTKTVNDIAHGLTAADIGKRLVLSEVDAGGLFRIVNTAIAGITDANNFTLLHSAGVNLPNDGGSIWYSVFSAHSETFIDMANLKVDKIIKLVDSISGLVAPESDFGIENIATLTSKKKGVFFNQLGEKLYLKKGPDVAAWGTLTLHYYRQPTLTVNDGDYVDIKDKYMGLVLAKLKNYIYEQLGQQAPESITNLIDNKTADIRRLNIEENAMIKDRQTNK